MEGIEFSPFPKKGFWRRRYYVA